MQIFWPKMSGVWLQTIMQTMTFAGDQFLCVLQSRNILVPLCSSCSVKVIKKTICICCLHLSSCAYQRKETKTCRNEKNRNRELSKAKQMLYCLSCAAKQKNRPDGRKYSTLCIYIYDRIIQTRMERAMNIL